jgi:hypothetical protein
MDTTAINSMASVDAKTVTKPDIQIEAGYQASLTQISGFEQSLRTAGDQDIKTSRVEKPSNAEKAVTKPLDFINNEATDIINYAKSAVESGNELTPSEIVTLTARSHEFMFHCQLTSNIANRTSDGLQQLFRQQS